MHWNPGKCVKMKDLIYSDLLTLFNFSLFLCCLFDNSSGHNYCLILNDNITITFLYWKKPSVFKREAFL